VGKPIPRSARSGLSGQIKAPNQGNPERTVIKSVRNERQKKAQKDKKLKTRFK